MEKNLVIVESPAKAKTIEKFLGKGYKVLSSYGHIRDLRKRDFSIDVEHGFTPEYEIPDDKAEVVNRLRTEAGKADIVWLASDEDREGEAIAWHLYEVLGLQPERTRRIVFHEITKNAILRAIEQPRTIDLNMVNAQQARRVLDRIVGFELSPVLWRKVKPSLSAGRVQSVAVRLIVEREREVQAFHSEAAYRVTATFLVPTAGGTAELRADLSRRYKTQEEAEALLEACRQATFTVADVVTKPQRKSPAPPFTTSTLQQEAARRLGMTVSQTMKVAQHLYESGHITYRRTDSVILSTFAQAACRETISAQMGPRYVRTRQFVTRTKGAQEAHEAIRPTHLDRTEIEGSQQDKRLYDLIWKRTIASQMAEAEVDRTTATISISGRQETFAATGEVIRFDGFLRVYRETQDDDADTQERPAPEGVSLPPLSRGLALTRREIAATERHTQHPPRYNEAALVRRLEELGIGRPSTYAPTISTIQQREYVVRGDKAGTERTYTVLTLKGDKIATATKKETVGAEKAKLMPTDVGIVVNDFLMQYFPDILDYGFTASVEQQFDEVAEGEKPWTELLAAFYRNFHPLVDAAINIKSEHRVGERILGTDPSTGRQVSVKIGRFGPVAQIGTANDADKPRFAHLGKGMSLETITLEEALDLFRLPRKLGQYEDKVVTVGEGRFGPYVLHDGKYASLPKGADPLALTLDEAIQLILAKREADAKRHLKAFPEEPELEILNGRWGPYIAYKGSNYRIPKGTEPESLTAADCLQLVEQQGIKEPKVRRGRAATTGSTAAKKASDKTTAKASTATKAKGTTSKAKGTNATKAKGATATKAKSSTKAKS